MVLGDSCGDRTADHNISEAVDSPWNFNAEKYNATLTFATAAVGIVRPTQESPNSFFAAAVRPS